MSPPSVTGEVYCFPPCQLIFSFDRLVHRHQNKLLTVHGKVLLRQWLTREAGWAFFFNLLCIIIKHHNYVLETVSCIPFLMNNK